MKHCVHYYRLPFIVRRNVVHKLTLPQHLTVLTKNSHFKYHTQIPFAMQSTLLEYLYCKLRFYIPVQSVHLAKLQSTYKRSTLFNISLRKVQFQIKQYYTPEMKLNLNAQNKCEMPIRYKSERKLSGIVTHHTLQVIISSCETLQ